MNDDLKYRCATGLYYVTHTFCHYTNEMQIQDKYADDMALVGLLKDGNVVPY